jgi:hypothetical protein
MKAIIIFFTFLFVVLMSTCRPVKRCGNFHSYLKKIEDRESYWVKSRYCIKKKQDFEIGFSQIKFFIYDRLTGDPIDFAVIWLNETTNYIVENGSYLINLENGVYTFEIVPYSGLGLKINNIKLDNIYIELNCFMGNTLQ